MNHPGRPPGFIRTHRVSFDTPPEPEPGDVVETFSGLQWRIVEVGGIVKTRHEVTEIKLAPEEYVENPEWVIRRGP